MNTVTPDAALDFLVACAASQFGGLRWIPILGGFQFGLRRLWVQPYQTSGYTYRAEGLGPAPVESGWRSAPADPSVAIECALAYVEGFPNYSIDSSQQYPLIFRNQRLKFSQSDCVWVADDGTTYLRLSLVPEATP